MPPFVLHPALLATSHAVADLPLCAVRLHDDARWPWLVLTPRRPGLVELDDLPSGERAQIVEEAARACTAVRALGAALDWPVVKTNLGALGNVTPQLHLHVVGRHPGDPAWPGPVWGVGVAEPYAPERRTRALEVARAALSAR